MIIRHATAGDLEGIRHIYNDVIVNTTAIYDYDPYSLEHVTQWFNSKAAEGFPVFVAIQNDVVKGFSTFGPFRRWGAYKYSVENSVYVSADARGKGIGKELLTKVIEAATQLNKHCVIAGIDATNATSIRLHEKLGFNEVAHFKQVGFKFNRWLDLKFYQLMLSTPAEPNSMNQ